MEQEHSKFDLIKKELQNFQRQRQQQSQNPNQGLGEKPVRVQDSSCAATVLVQKLMKILETEDENQIGSEMQMQTSPEQKALSNSLVVREILSYMDIFNLFKFRQVSRLWIEEATSILLSSKPVDFLCVKFEWWLHRAEFCTGEMYSLSDFMQSFMDNPRIFQFTQLIFSGGQINNPTLLQFFSDYGGHVQHLGLFPESVTSSAEMAPLGNIIFKWTPNLKSLALKGNLLEMREVGERQGHPISSLPNLRKLILGPKRRAGSSDPEPESPLLQKIFTSAPNLTSIEGTNLAYISQIVSAGKLPLVKSTTWDFLFTNPFLEANFIQFVAAGGQPRELTLIATTVSRNVFRNERPVLDALRSLFQLGQNTLKSIHGVDHLSQVLDPSYKLPPLLKVTKLCLSACQTPEGRILPQGNALSDVFPNLKEMQVQVGSGELYPFTSPLNAHSGLKKLEISLQGVGSKFCFQSEWVESLANFYPKLTHLHLDLKKMGRGNFPEGLGLISMNFEELEELVLEIRIKGETCNKFKKAMDFALSGLPPQICEQLWSSREINPEYQKLEVLDEIRIAPSIIDLKKLTNLTFVVHFEKSPGPIWTHLAEYYAFQPMIQSQGLQVNIRGFQNQSVMFNGSELRPV